MSALFLHLPSNRGFIYLVRRVRYAIFLTNDELAFGGSFREWRFFKNKDFLFSHLFKHSLFFSHYDRDIYAEKKTN